MKPVDQAERHAAVHRTDLTVALSAGAGSGKTSVLVARVLKLLKDGIDPAQIAVVTFTEKAAGELQERIRDGLEERRAEPALARALARFHDLTLTTLHGFCLELLEGAALHASWAPDTEIIPEGLQSPAALPLLSRWREDYSCRHPGHALLLRAMLQGSQQLAQGVQRLLDTRDAEPVLGDAKLDFDRAKGELTSLRDQLRAAAAACTAPDDKLLVQNQALLADLDALTEIEDSLSCVVRAYLAQLKGSLTGGTKAAWPGASKERFKAAVRAVRAWATHLGGLLHAHVVADLREHLVPAIERALRHRGHASYADLLFRAADLLEDEPAVRCHLAERYRAILIDEVQDTDPIQARVAAFLTRQPDLDGDWLAHPPRPGHLFAVGDAKQSIFRFRRADVEAWTQLRSLAPSAGRLELVQNFRSVPGVVGWVNEAFGELPGFEAQVPWRGEAQLDPVVRLDVAGIDPAEAIGRYLRSIEDAAVADRATGELRRLQMQDVLVVLPSWTHANALHTRLAEAGIASVIEGGSTFFSSSEVVLACAVMTCLNEPVDTESCCTVLRGLFGLNWEEIASHVAAGGSLLYTRPEQPTGPVSEALALLLRLHRVRGERSLVRLLDELLEETAATAVWSLLPDGEGRLANLEKLRVLVRQIEGLGATTGQTIAELRRLQNESAEEELSRLDTDLDAVRITSVFKAKGREAPVVVLAFAGRKAPSPQHRVEGDRAWVKLSKLEPPDWKTKRIAEKTAFEEERGRWMYVAATRARDQLVVVDDNGNLLEWIRAALPDGDHQQLVQVGESAVRVVHAQELAAPDRSSDLFPGLDIESMLGAPPPAAARPRDASVALARQNSTTWVSVGQLARRGKPIYGVPGGVGARGGTLVHQVLERIDLSATRSAQLARLPALLAERAAVAQIPSDLAERCLTILERILACPELDMARAAPLHWREASFTYETEDGMLTGIIDLAFPLDEAQTHWMVIDWKSTLPPSDHPARDIYARQLELYAKAMIANVAPCERVTTALVGPHAELGQDALPELDLAFDELGPLLLELLDAGVPAPVAGLDLGDLEAGHAELAWPDSRVCLLVDPDPAGVASLERAGWTVVAADSGQAGWSRQAGHSLRQTLLQSRPTTPDLGTGQGGEGDTMLGLVLREEFRGRRLKGTQIELPQAIKMAAADFLRITYPSGDVLKAVEAIGPNQGRPVVLIGERGQGKSHLMAALVHALSDSAATRTWLEAWADRLQQPAVAEIPLREGMHVISENLARQNYKYLWDLLFERHPKGEYIKGKWEAQGDRKTPVPGDALLKEMFEAHPTALVLDEFQTWFDGLTDSRSHKSRTWAFNFIQILSELSKEHPDKVVLVVSLRNGSTEAYRQVHRVNPALVDWKGQSAKRDRQRLLLHRLFENRLNIAPTDIEHAIAAHVAEHLRLADVPSAEHDKVRRDFNAAWPFAPHLMQLLEDQVLVATSAQETRDLIKILAALFKRQGDDQPILTAADFRLDDEKSAIASLIDSVANAHHQSLREKALRNMEAVRDAVPDCNNVVPHLAELVSTLWVRSLAIGNLAGATEAALHVDITRGEKIDDNTFQDELSLIVENSFNIHQQGDRLIFKDEENPQAKLMANAKNAKLFAADQPKAGQDLAQLAKEVRYVIGDAASQRYRVVVLGKNWVQDPWSDVDETEGPDRWTDGRIPLVVLPECPDKVEERLGVWLKDHLQKGRNTVRFLVPHDGANNAFFDRDLLILSRAVVLASEWMIGSPEYRRLKSKYETELRSVLKKRFDRFAVIDTWDYAQPKRCEFTIVPHKAQGSGIPDAIDKYIREQLFIPEDFREIVEAAAENTDSVAKLLSELQEPRPGREACVPWVGETLVKEKLERLCAQGVIAINLRGSELLQQKSGEDEDTAWRRVKGKLGRGRHLEETKLLMPQPEGTTGGVVAGGGETGAGASTGGGTTAGGGEAPGGGTTTGGGETGGGTTAGGDTTTGGGTTGGGGIFGGGSTTSYSAPATSGLNLLMKVESWGIGSFTQVRKASVTVEGLTGAQLSELLKKLPDGATYALEVEKED